MPISFFFGKTAFDVETILISVGLDDCERHFDKTAPTMLFHANEEEDTLTLSYEAVTALKIKRPTIESEENILVSVTESPRLQFPGNSSALASFADLSDTLNF